VGYIRHLSPEELKQLKKDRIKEKKNRKNEQLNNRTTLRLTRGV
jgi:hypothetical protein